MKSLLRIFKKEKAGPAAVAVAALPRTPLEKPASERFGKTVMPNSSRVVAAGSAPAFPGASRPVSLGEVTLAPAGERTVALALGELLAQIPADLLATTEVDRDQRLVFNASELERGMANGRPIVPLSAIYAQAPELFRDAVSAQDTREVALPFEQVLRQFAGFQLRADQEPGQVPPQVETPFLQVTIEDSERFGTASPVSPSIELPPAVARPPALADEVIARAPVAKETPAPKPEVPTPPPPTVAAPPSPKLPPLAPIRLTMPPAEESKAAAPSPKPPATIASPAPAEAPAPKLFPNGTGAPASERVPASSGSPVPIPLPAPFAPPAPARIPFKMPAPPPVIAPAAAAAPAKPAGLKISIPAVQDESRIHLSLREILRGVPPFQLAGKLEEVPAEVKIELPFALIAPQLALGRVAISPEQFQAAIPEAYRALYLLDDGGLPVALPLPEVLQNLPNESLKMRPDQVETVVPQIFETPFSQKAAEDAERLKVPAGPISKADLLETTAPAATPLVPEEVQPALEQKPAERNALQVLFDTGETLDAKAIVAHASQLPGISACAIIFSDGLSLAGNIPAEYNADAIGAIAPEILKRISEQMAGASLGRLQGVTLFCEKASVSFFAHDSICLAALHAGGEIAPETREKLGRITGELARLYAPPA